MTGSTDFKRYSRLHVSHTLRLFEMLSRSKQQRNAGLKSDTSKLMICRPRDSSRAFNMALVAEAQTPAVTEACLTDDLSNGHLQDMMHCKVLPDDAMLLIVKNIRRFLSVKEAIVDRMIFALSF